MERPGDEVREELRSGQHGGVVRRERGEHAGRGQQVLHRVVAEQGREDRAHRRQVADLVRGRQRDALRGQATGQRAGEGGGQPDDHQGEEDPDRQGHPRVLEGGPHARR